MINNLKQPFIKTYAGSIALLLAFLSISIIPVTGNTQVNRNEWIDYSKTYYKFKALPVVMPNDVRSNLIDGADYGRLMRIPFSTLTANGLAANPVEHFKLFRNGVEVALNTYPSTGIMSSDGYLEFWALPNDGTTDTDMYVSPNDQPNKRWSLYNDTSSYFLTVSTVGTNKRFANVAHDPLNSATVPEPWFMHNIHIDPHSSLNRGFAVVVANTELRSSRYDAGEGWSDIRFGSDSVFYKLGGLMHEPSANANIGVYAQVQTYASALPWLNLNLNHNQVRRKQNGRYRIDSMGAFNLPLSYLSGTDSATITVRLESLTSSYRIAVNRVNFVYPRKFSFSKNTRQFAFTLPANPQSRKLKIVDFDAGSGAEKILLDLTSLKKYTGVIEGDTTWFEINGSATESNFVLASYYQEPQSVATLSPLQFTNYSLAPSQGDYLIISNKKLSEPLNGEDQVEAYRSYRSGVTGGSYNARIYFVDELYDQFGYGINNHSIAVRNFIRYTASTFTTKPKAALLLGRGATYDHNVADINAANLNLVPTWGWPASDNQMGATTAGTAIPNVTIGRVAAITPQEIKDYLDKIKAFDTEQQNAAADHSWQKKTLHLIGGSDAGIVQPITNFMQKYENIIEDTLVGGSVSTYLRVNNPNISLDNTAIRQGLQNGTGLITYFGHSSKSSFDFNLNQPEELPVTGGRYPVFLVNGCSAADFFNLNTRRYNQLQLTLSEKFVVTPGAGSIAFLSTTTLGILQYLDLFTTAWYNAAVKTNYGKTLGDLHKEAITKLLETTGTTDVQARLTAESFLLHGDPAVRIHTQAKPDYSPGNATLSSDNLTLLGDSLQIKIPLRNSGAAINTPVKVLVTRTLPGGKVITIADSVVAPLTFERSMVYKLAFKSDEEIGLNQFDISVDPANGITESNETNNTTSVSFEVKANGIIPVSPIDYGIISTWPTLLNAHAGKALAPATTYRLQLDTTIAFNSPLLHQQDTTVAGISVAFNPTNSLIDNTTYYWRLTALSNGSPTTWAMRSFTYEPGVGEGFHQQHYYQHLNSTYKGITIDPADRWLKFLPRLNNLYFFHGVYPTASNEDGQLSITQNGVTRIYSACVGQSIIVNVFDSLSFIPWKNSGGDYGSGPVCNTGREYNFEIKYYPASNRKKLMDLLDLIPNGNYVAMRLVLDPDPGQPGFLSNGKADSAMVEYWKRDTLIYGSGQSLYHKLLNNGFKTIDELNTRRTFSFLYKKGDTTSFKPQYVFSDGLYDIPVLSADLPMTDTAGLIKSPWFGPAVNWQQLHWRGKAYTEPNGIYSDSVKLILLGRKENNVVDTLYRFPLNHKDVNFAGDSVIDAATYPYMQMVLEANDSDNATPYPLNDWQVLFTPKPDGTVDPADHVSVSNNAWTTEIKNNYLQTDSLYARIAFKNVSPGNFTDSIHWQIVVEDSVYGRTIMASGKIKPLNTGDTAHIKSGFPINGLGGKGFVSFEFNADRPAAELTLNNNRFYVPITIEAPPVTYPPNLKVFYGNGNWSDAGKWLPVGVPVCTDKVIVHGSVTVDMNNAVCDTMFITKQGQLMMQNANSHLQVGCTNGGGNKPLNVSGTLTLNDGLLEINGALRIADGATFTQSGGEILIDVNTGFPASSMQFATMGQASLHPAAALSIGGFQPASDTLNRPFTSGSVNFSGGKTIIVDPSYTPGNYSFYWNNTNASAPLFGINHTLQFGHTSGINISQDPQLASYHFYVQQGGGTAQLMLGNLLIKGEGGTQRHVHINGNNPFTLEVAGKTEIAPNSGLRLLPGMKLLTH